MKVESGAVHLWVEKTSSRGGLAEFHALLSSDEVERSERFLLARHRDAFVVSRALLRRILSGYVGGAAEDITFEYGEHGKPSVAGVHFNVSDSSDLMVVALSDVEVGVDLERIRPRPNACRFASRFFTSQEADAISSAPEHERDRWFFSCWTRKEAYVKALGGGLTIPLKSFSVGCEPALERPALSGARGWSLSSFTPAEGFVAAICSAGSPPELIFKSGG